MKMQLFLLKNDVTYVDMGHICYCYFSKKKIFKSLSLD